MSVINKGTSFSNGEQLTAKKINDMLDLAEFNQSATDSASTTVNSASQIVVADSGVTTAKLATDAVETAKIKDANVTTAKIADANVTFAKLADVIDDDTMATATATNLATSESIKAYVDTTTAFTPSTYAGEESVTLPNGLIMKFGLFSGVTTTGTTLSFGSAFPTAVISATATGNTTNTITISSNYAGKCAVSNVTTSGMKIWGEPGTSAGSSAYWTAIGH